MIGALVPDGFHQAARGQPSKPRPFTNTPVLAVGRAPLASARRGRVDMGIAVGTDQRADLHAASAADVLHEEGRPGFEKLGDDRGACPARSAGAAGRSTAPGNHDHRPTSGQPWFLLCAACCVRASQDGGRGRPAAPGPPTSPEQQRENVKRAGRTENDRGAWKRHRCGRTPASRP